MPLDTPRAGVYLFAVIALLMLVVGTLACLVPTRRALAVHPMEALRES